MIWKHNIRQRNVIQYDVKIVTNGVFTASHWFGTRTGTGVYLMKWSWWAWKRVNCVVELIFTVKCKVTLVLNISFESVAISGWNSWPIQLGGIKLDGSILNKTQAIGEKIKSTRMHSSRMCTAWSSSRQEGICFSACWDTPPQVWALRPPWCGPWDP